MTHYLVTGGAGFIGSHIAHKLVDEGHDVRVLDDFSTGKRRNIEPFADRCKIIEGDIRDAAVVEKAVRGVDVVFHEAALASVPRSINDPASTNEVNVRGTLNLLIAAKNNGVKRFVYASSSSAYGDSPRLPKEEQMATNPKSPYAVSKLAGEMYCLAFSEVYKIPTTSLRYFNVFGPRQDPDSQYAAVIPLFVKTLLEGKRPVIFGDGEQSRDFTYVDNVVSANLLASRSNLPGGRVYNVACGTKFTLNSLYRELNNILDVHIEPVYDPPRPGDVKHSQASMRAIETDLGYRTLVPFEEALRRTVRWYQEASKSV